jgi:Family of unknown function (DUF6941)
MASPVLAKLILCDHAVADPAGKVHMLGAGWSLTSSPTPPHAVVVLMKIPWDRADQKIEVSLALLTADGEEVVVQSPTGPVPIAAHAEVEAGRPPGLAPGGPMDASFALNVQPLPLSPGRYQWRLQVAGGVLTESFEVRRAS